MIEIIAEAANGHEGDAGELCRLTELAAAAGADAVKFQLVYASELCTRDYEHFELFRSYELGQDAWERAAAIAHQAKCRLYLDVFGPLSVSLATDVGADGVKLHASDTANLSLVDAVARSSVQRVILSVGGARRLEIAAATDILVDKNVVLMHGFLGYPPLSSDTQIGRLRRLRADFPWPALGFADHVPAEGPERTWLSAVAVGAGATVLEKHITLARIARRTDHEAALDPDDFAEYVANMRLASDALTASGLDADDYGMRAGELEYRRAVRKSVVAAHDIPGGTILDASDLALKRSGDAPELGMDPKAFVGRMLAADAVEDTPLTPEMLD
jgi:N,N'-diacetyllegionaminate synthase